MATDGPDPTPCDPDIFSHGRHVGLLAGPGPNAIEAWVKELAAASGARVDWHFFGGRANVLTLGDVAIVRAEFERAIPELKARFPHLVWR